MLDDRKVVWKECQWVVEMVDHLVDGLELLWVVWLAELREPRMAALWGNQQVVLWVDEMVALKVGHLVARMVDHLVANLALPKVACLDVVMAASSGGVLVEC